MPNVLDGAGGPTGGGTGLASGASFAAGGTRAVGSSLDYNDLFVRKLGRLATILNLINSTRGGTVAALVDVVAAVFANDAAATDGLHRALRAWQQANGAFLTYLKGLAQAAVIDDVNAARPLPDRSLGTALGALIADSRAAGMTVTPSVVWAASAPNPGTLGTPAVVVTTRTAGGTPTANAFGEFLTITCADDAQGGATAGREPLQVVGTQAVADPLGWDWPGGSGAAVGLRAVDAAQDATSSLGGSANWLVNGDFENFGVPNIPDNWRVAAGTPGTTLKRSNDPLSGVHSLDFVGNSSEQTSIYQRFSGDTPTAFPPLTQVVWNLWCRVDTPPAAGVLEISLVDGSGTVVNDAAGTPNLLAQPLTALGSYGYGGAGAGGYGIGDGGGGYGSAPYGSIPYGAYAGAPFASVSGSFRTPAVVPAGLSLRLKLSTPLTTGSTLTIDRVALARPTQLYPQGPAVAVFSGLVPLAKGDGFALAVHNGRESQTQELFDKFFDMRSLGFLLPAGAPPTLPDLFASQSTFEGLASGSLGGSLGAATGASGGGGGGAGAGFPFGNGSFFNPGPPLLP